MMKTAVKQIATILLSCSLVVASMVIAPMWVSADELYVPAVEQEKSHWCWAACAEMVGQYEEPGSTRNQSDVVQHVMGSTVNKMGNGLQTAEGAEYVCYSISTFLVSGRFTESQIEDMIDDTGNPLVAGIVWVDEDGNVESGHMMVVAGYDGEEVQVIDPANGTKQYMEYSDLRYYDDGLYYTTVYTND